MLDARSFMISTLRSQVGFAAAVARMPVSASHVSSSSGALAAPPAVTHLPREPSFRQTAFEQARGGALGAGGGRVGFAGGGLF